MDALMDNQDAVDGVMASLLRPLVDQDLSLAFYDMTVPAGTNLLFFSRSERACSSSSVFFRSVSLARLLQG
jgi:hypothetical protein